MMGRISLEAFRRPLSTGIENPSSFWGDWPVGWVEPTGRANARPMTGSAIPIHGLRVGWVSLRSTHPAQTHTSAFPRRVSPGLCKSFRPKRRGRRECRVLAAPAVSCAIVREKCAHEHTGTVGAFRHSLRSGFTAYAALSPETNSSCLRHRRIDGVRAPGRARNTSADLTPATGARTTRFCRTHSASFVCRAPIAHGPKPALPSASRNRRCRVHRIPSPTSVTIAIRPSWRAGTRRLYR